MKEIILEKRYPHSREEDITDAFMRGYEIGKEQEHRWWSNFCANCKDADRKTENSSEKPNNCDTCIFELYCPEMCEGCCEWDSRYEPKDEPFDKDINVRCKTEPQTDCADTNLSEKPTDSERSE